MSDDITRNIKKIAREAETTIAKSLLSWKYRKEGIEPPGEEELSRRSREIAGEAHRAMVEGGKSAWRELKTVYSKGRPKDGGADS